MPWQAHGGQWAGVGALFLYLVSSKDPAQVVCLTTSIFTLWPSHQPSNFFVFLETWSLSVA